MLPSNTFKRSDGIDDVTIYVESDKDLTRIPIWEFHHAKFDFWERGQVEIPKFEDYRVSLDTTELSLDYYPIFVCFR